MHIAHELKMFQPQIVKPKHMSVSPEVLEKVYSAISDGFNMTHRSISKVTGLSITQVVNAVNRLYNLGYLSKITVKNSYNVDQFAYTAIKPFKGE